MAPAYVQPSFDEKSEHSIREYVPLVHLVEELRSEGLLDNNSSKIETVASLWLSAARGGRLRPFESPILQDVARDGATADIFRARTDLAFGLMKRAQMYSRQGKFGESARLLAESLEISQIAKYTSLGSVGDSAIMQCQILTQSCAIADKWPVQARIRLVAQTDAIEKSKQNLGDLVRKIKALYRMDLIRFGSKATLGAKRELKFVTMLVNEGRIAALTKFRSTQFLAEEDSTLPSLAVNALQAINMEEKLDKMLQTTKEKLLPGRVAARF